MNLSETQLVARCLQGDEDAWAELITRYERLIYTVPLRYGLPHDLADEVFQTVCVALLEQLGRIAHPERIGAWLVTTARRESWRVARRRMASLATHDDDAGTNDTLAADDPLPDEQFEQLEQAALVRAALRRLDERCRSLLTLLYVEEQRLSYAEIATMLAMKEGSIGPTRARCLKKLQQLLEVEYGER